MSDLQAGFLSLLETHDYLDELFGLHQQAVLLMNWDLAEELLSAYRKLLELHISHEEGNLLPLFERAGQIPRAPSILFTGQHKKLLGQLQVLASRLAHAREDGIEPRRHAIALLDLETTFKHLSEHHDGAEMESFYPTIQRIASEQEHQTILVRCRSEWCRARDSLVDLVARAHRVLEASAS